jgi:molecular chaperone DnaK (HSP70)
MADIELGGADVVEPNFAGIDLGTTFSAIAVVDEHAQPQAIPNAEGELTTPSAVHVHADGSFVVGRSAQAHANDTIQTFKRFMGGDQTFLVAGRRFSPVDLSAALLRKLATDASDRLQRPIREVVISVPAYFGQLERDATRAAGEQAGLVVLQLISEPTAAANVYASRQQLEEGHLLVFDLGGGTFDVTLLEVTPTGPYVKRTGGSVHLGGQDFTDSIVTSLAQRYAETHHLEIAAEARMELGRRAEAAKITLSDHEQAEITFSAHDGPMETVTLTRTVFDESIAGYLMQVQMIIELLLDRVQLAPRDIRKVLLVGGSSRIPSVRALLRQTFGQAPDESLDPDLAVAWGAAQAAAGFKREGATLKISEGGLRITDSVSHAVGVKALRGGLERYVFDAVLPAGFPLEKWSEARHYSPERAGEPNLRVEVYQGDTTDLAGCMRLGEVRIPLPEGSRPDATQVRVWMKLNRSGLLEVQVSVNDGQPHQAEFRI